VINTELDLEVSMLQLILCSC